VPLVSARKLAAHCAIPRHLRPPVGQKIPLVFSGTHRLLKPKIMPTLGENNSDRIFREQDRLGYVPVLDGIRGIAILAVVGCHLNLGWMRGGFFGVDIFFALSGFLITTMLLEEQARHGSISLRDFFRRRFWRLYPALFVLLIFSAASGILRQDVGLDRVALVIAATLAYVSNWLLIADSQAWVGGLGHTWSLAVEVHFYLFWAATLAWAVRRWGIRPRPLFAFALTIAIASELWRIVVWATTSETGHAYAGTNTRLDSLFFGVAAALIRLQHLADPAASPVTSLTRGKVRALEIGLVLGLVWLISRTEPYSAETFVGGFGFVGGATALLILITLLHPASLLARPLQNGLLVWFGQISYSLYLWHLPVDKFVTAERLSRWVQGEWLVTVVRLLVTILLAVISYYLVERTFLRLRHRARRTTTPAS